MTKKIESKVKMMEVPINFGEDDRPVGSFTAYVSVWDKVDRANEYTVKGCSEESIQKMNGSFPVLWNHKHSDLIGFADVKEDSVGIFVDGLLSDDEKKAPLSANALEMMRLAHRKGTSLGLSIGYIEIESEYDNNDVLRLKKIELVEVSLAPVQCLTDAHTLSVKKVETMEGEVKEVKDVKKKQVEKPVIEDNKISIRELEKSGRDDYYLTKSEAKGLVTLFKSLRDADTSIDDVLEIMKEKDDELKCETKNALLDIIKPKEIKEKSIDLKNDMSEELGNALLDMINKGK